MNDTEILKFALSNSMIDIATMRMQVEETMKNSYLQKHNKPIWQGKGDKKWYTYLPDENSKNHRKLIKRNTREEVEELIISFYQGKKYTFEQMFYRWIDDKLANNEIYKQSYDRYVTTYKRYFADISKETFCDITPQRLERFIRRTIASKHLTAKQWADMRIVVKGVFAYGKYDTDISITQFMGDLNLSPRIFAKKVKSDTDETFTDEEIAMIEKEIMANPDIVGYGIIFGIRTGMRVGELAGLKKCDIQGDTIHVCRTEIHYKDNEGHNVYEVRDSTKGAEGERDVVILDDDIRVLKEIRRLNPFGEFLLMKDGKRISSRSMTSKLYRICNKLKIPPRSMHKCRKAYATKLLNANVKASIIKSQLGHTDVKTTIDYYYKENVSHDDVLQSIAVARRM